MDSREHHHGAPGHELKAGAMGVGSIVLLVVATAAPLTAMATAMPVAVALGNGVGVPGTYLIVALVLGLFAVGYAAMSRHVTNAGAFYAYITAGLGRRLGMAAGLVAVLSYNVLALYVVGLVGFFAHQTFASELGVDIPWEVFAFGGLAIALGLGIRGIELNARVLGVLLIAETAFLVVLDVAVLVTEGPSAFTLHAFDPSAVFDGAVGIGFMFVFISFIGFEATAIFGEEAKDPRRTVSRATMVAIAFIGVVYLVSSWAIIGANGGTQAQSVALADPGLYAFGAAENALGGWSTHVMSWLVLTSLIAVMMAIHNMATRYLMAFGREGILPRRLGETHARFKTPYVAAWTQAGFVAVVVLVYALAGADPYLDLGNQMAGMGALGVIALMAVTSASVIAYFRRRPDRNLAKHVLAPGIACVGLVIACYLVIDNYSLLTGSDSAIVNGLPWLLVLTAVVGYVIGSVRPLRAPIDVFASAPTAEPLTSPDPA